MDDMTYLPFPCCYRLDGMSESYYLSVTICEVQKEQSNPVMSTLLFLVLLVKER